MKKIIGIVGSGTEYSTNEQLLDYIKRYYTDAFELEIINPKSWPLFNKPIGGKLPAIIQEVSQKIDKSDAVIISAAEYNRSVSAVLSNALAWLSFMNYPFVGKLVLTIGTSNDKLGASRAQTHLHQMLESPQLRAVVMPDSDYLLPFANQAFDANGDLTDPDDITELDSVLNRLGQYITVHEKMADLNIFSQSEAEAFDQKYIFNEGDYK